MTPAAVTLTRALETALDGQAINQRERDALYNPDPEVNSLAERIVALRHHGVPDHIVRALIADVREVLELNELEAGCHAGVARRLETIVDSLRLHQQLTVKSIARALRDPLRVIANPAGHDTMAYVAAVGAVNDVLRQVPREQLLTRSVAHELRATAYGLLEQLVNQRTGERA